jgi:hypothetical protein
MDWTEYLRLVYRALLDNPEWRVGQTFYNVLAQHRPDLAAEVDCTDLDPFYDDSRLTRFRDHIRPPRW